MESETYWVVCVLKSDGACKGNALLRACIFIFIRIYKLIVVHHIAITINCMWTLNLLHHNIWKCKIWNRILTLGRYKVEDDLHFCGSLVYKPLRSLSRPFLTVNKLLSTRQRRSAHNSFHVSEWFQSKSNIVR